ncbi:MAG: acyltransferase family protein, partial [Paracoccaceae bacterium]
MAGWSDIREVARQTPPERDRYVDFLRIVAICFVVVGHWNASALFIDGEKPQLEQLLKFAPWAQWATWLFQVMPIFFFVGGYSNGASWASASRREIGFASWARDRLTRLLLPLVPLVAVWVIAGSVGLALQLDSGLVSNASRLSLIPVWFLAVYVVVTLVTPVTRRLWKTHGMGTFWALAAGAVVVDAVALSLDAIWLRWINYGFIWLALHQLGYAWQDGHLEKLHRPLTLAAVGAVGFLFVEFDLSYPIAMVSVPGQEISNSRPPSVALLTLGMVQTGLVVAVAAPMRRLMQRETLWMLTIFDNRVIMTLFLWHVSAMVLSMGLAVFFLGGLGLHEVPGSGQWWWLRIPWMVAFAAVTWVFIFAFSGFERRARPVPQVASPEWKVAGALFACYGLIFLALYGIISESGHGIRILPAAAVVSRYSPRQSAHAGEANSSTAVSIPVST